MDTSNFMNELLDRALKDLKPEELSKDVLCDIFSTVLLNLQSEIKEKDAEIKTLVKKLFELKNKEESIINILDSVFETTAKEVEILVGEHEQIPYAK